MTNTVQFRRGLFALAFAVATGAAFGETAYFVHTNSYFDCKWTDTRTSAGNPLWLNDYVPVNADDVVYLSDPVAGPFVVNGRFWPVTSGILNIDSIAYGPHDLLMYFHGWSDGVTLRDAEHCFSAWVPTVAGVTFKKTPNTPGELVFQNIRGGYGSVFQTDNVGDKIRIANLYTHGLITKKGAGELTLDKPTGERSIVNLHAGTLTFGADASYLEDAPATNVFIRFDASETNTLKTFVGDDGRTYVTNWTSCGSQTFWARAESATSRPFLSEEKVNGVSLVDFGGCSTVPADVETYGPSGYLQMQPSYPEPTEAFMVVQANSTGISDAGPICGNWYNDGLLASTSTGSLFHRQGNRAGMKAQVTARLNGSPFGNGADEFRDPRQLAVISAYADGEFGQGGGSWWYLCRRYDTARIGGLKVAEIITYNRVLTETERRRTIRYLQRKWLSQTDRKAYDTGVVTVRGASTAVNVAAGNRAEVRAIRVQNTAHAFVKTGTGELVVEQTYPEKAEVKVEGGRLVFENSAVPAADPQPAPGAAFHADATASASLIHTLDDQGRPLESLEMWRDCRAGVTICLTNTLVNGVVAEKPYVTSAAMNGRATVDFGTAFSDTGARFTVVDQSGAALPKFVDTFVVWKSLTGDPEHDKAPGFFGYSDWSFRRNDKNNIAGSLYDCGEHVRIDSALYTIDGMPAVRDGDGYKLGLDAPVVLGISFPYPQNINRIGATSPAWKGGGIRIAEILLYDRRLSETERRDTETYLLKKWKGVDTHPAYRTTVGKLTFAGDAAAEVAVANGTRTFARVETAEDALVKTGAGSATVASLPTNVVSFAANEGSLAVTAGVSFVEQVLSEAKFHLDTSKADSSFVTEETDGKVYVTRVNHAEGTTGAAYAYWPVPEKISVTNKPTLVETTIGGVSRKVLDFGEYMVGPKDAETGVYQFEGGTGAGLKPSAWLNATELYIVRRDTDASKRTFIYSTWEYWMDRGANGVMFKNGAQNVFDGKHPYRLDVDGVERPHTDVLEDGWHVISFTSETMTPAVTWLGCGTVDGKFYLGGEQIAEYIVFTGVRHDAATREKIRDYLRRKWMGASDGLVCSFGNLSAGAGAALSVTVPSEYASLSPSSVSGEGTIHVDGAVATLLSQMESKIADGAVSCLTIDGAVTFADTGTVRITVGDPNLKAGVYPILTAQSIANPLAVRSWTLELSVPLRRTARLMVRENAVCLEVLPNGLLMIVR